MDTDTCLFYLTLIESKQIPVPIISRLLSEFGSARALRQLPSAVLTGLGFSDVQIELLQCATSQSQIQQSVQESMDWAEKEGNSLVCYESPLFPSLLREIDSPPPLLYVKGSLAALENRHIALVGSRRATIYGKKNAYWMAQELSKAGLQVCSGMALGIDTKAHEGALDSGGKTIAVIGTGIDRVYPPANKNLAQRICENGALVSEFPLGTPAYPGNFPRRNRIISGLADGTLVVEANLKSGSLISAGLAMEQNREVFAIPGPVASPQSRGCHKLIKQGAKLVEEPTDVLEEFGLFKRASLTSREAKSVGSGNAEKLVALQAIDYQGCLFQAIQTECDLSPSELNGQLIQLEAAGLIQQTGGRYYRLD
ncbi:MAG: DNA processing protein DprA [Pseudohongiella sp.]|nr:MAG: DNA processing protein DprA [Pseudohongiella sp.]